jgi:hypothetical protein
MLYCMLYCTCRDAGRLFGTPKKNRAGRVGQLVRAVLRKAGVAVYEVSRPAAQCA